MIFQPHLPESKLEIECLQPSTLDRNLNTGFKFSHSPSDIDIDSRNAGKRVYKPLILNKFTGTYINWSNDYVMFKKSEGRKSLEDIYMTYEGNLPPSMPHFDLVLNLQRLAISPCHLGDFIRVTSDPLGEINESNPGFVLCYPNLKEVAVVECWTSVETETQDMGIQPKQIIPYDNLPEYFCPLTKIEVTPEGVRVLLNRWHQPCTWMRVVPQGGKLLTIKEKPRLTISHTQPTAPERLPGISRHSLANLQDLCKERDLDSTGNRQALIRRLHDDEAVTFPVVEERYKQDLRKWAGAMLGHTENPSGVEYSDEVKVARAQVVTEVRIFSS